MLLVIMMRVLLAKKCHRAEKNNFGENVDHFISRVTISSISVVMPISFYCIPENEMRNQMSELFPELQPKVSYHQPNFRVKAGRFTNRLEANRIHRAVKEEFPRALLIPDRFRLVYE